MVGKVCEIGQFQRWHRKLVLGAHMQYFPACHEHLELWAGREQICHVRSCPNHLLEIVQQQ